jgi:hypothetical protein
MPDVEWLELIETMCN